MKWIKKGMVFDLKKNPLKLYKGFSQSPQTLIFKDFVRVYFSTRVSDSTGKYLSYIIFADFSKDFKEVLNISEKPVVSLGDIGCFDEHGIFPINILDLGDKIYGYTCGWSRRVSVSVETAIGLVVSKDHGLTFHRMGNGPILTASLHEPYLVGDAFVKLIDNQFHMWYIFGTNWSAQSEQSIPERTYKIGHSISSNGIDWSPCGGKSIIPDRLGPNECQALPSVIKIEKTYHLFFCYRETFDFRSNKCRGYKIGHAYSDNLYDWVRDDDNPSFEINDNDWDSEMQCYPHVFEVDKKIYMLYNGNSFGSYGFGLAELAL